jgi:hypothetical protein
MYRKPENNGLHKRVLEHSVTGTAGSAPAVLFFLSCAHASRLGESYRRPVSKYRLKRNFTMTRGTILATAIFFAMASGALAQGPAFETIYDPNASGLTVQPEGPPNDPLLDGGREEKLYLNHPMSHIFENVSFGHAEDHAN